ncbi:Ig-like domain-containing protein [Methanogenium organophilum]|uniref:Big-1 domain-containing protein n=1 Tax=Methanogenium organophilum TaxID=2199 RepID=A0A9X9S6L0_METOG|nr:hypothetical protein [Methanogenium organophilum]WAI02392.1 hypothetical protein OU421_05845 [Methanogenium organophilum]
MNIPRVREMTTLLICCLLCFTAAAAATPDQISVTSDRDQIVAGDTGAHILAEPDPSLPPVSSVSFVYLNRTVDPTGLLTPTVDATAPFETLFTTELAGTAYIQVDITFADENTDPVTTIFTQDVIPGDPYAYESIVPDAVQAGSAGPVTVRMQDRYGNAITAVTGATVTFSTSREGSGFVDGAAITQTITKAFDAEGNCTTYFIAPETAEPVIISVDPSPGSSLQRLITVRVIAERTPASINPYIVTVPHYPVTGTCPADGISYFLISYVIKDQFGNPIDNYPVTVSTTLGESAEIVTSEDGVAKFTYGPKTGMGDVTITATAGSLSEASELSFTGGAGTRFSVTLNPNNIPSYDVDPDTLIAVQARVYNDLGTGVEGETIHAWITPGSVNATNTISQEPGLSANRESGFGYGTAEAITGEDGFATFYFRAGAFPPRGDEEYEPFSRGSATVTAMWNNQTGTSPEITWRNYPYLRVETEVSDVAIAPGDPLNVTIRLIGDGNELLSHNPIDVALCLDRGEDMLVDEGLEDRMERARRAAMYLVEGDSGEIGLTPGYDRVALISYSDRTTDTTLFPTGAVDLDYINDNFPTYNWIKLAGDDSASIDNLETKEGYVLAAHYPGSGFTEYNDFATIDETFATAVTSDWSGLESTLRYTVPFKADDTGQASAPLRYGLKKSIEYLADNDKPGAIQAVVVLMQNNYRYFGDPFANGSVMTVLPYSNTLAKGGSEYYSFGDLPADQQNMVDYARANDVKIYAIYYPSGGSQSDEAVPRRLAEDTGGDYYFAGNEAELTEAFRQIRDSLLRDAGVNTNVNLNFAGMPEDVSYTADEVLEYLPPTHVDFYNWSADPYVPSDHLNGFPYTEDQTVMWRGEDGSQPASLSFVVGNVTIKQTWTVDFNLQVNESIDSALNFSLFAEGSYVEFENQDGGNIIEALPETMITVIPGLTPDALLNATIHITAFDLIAQDAQTARFAWDIAYDGIYPLTEELALKNTEDVESVWQTVDISTLSPETNSSTGMAFTGDLTPGIYSARIKVTTEDAGHDSATHPLTIGEDQQYFIRLE